MELDRIYYGDCRSLFGKIPSESIDLIATDQPYRITPRGGTGTMSGFMTNSKARQGRIFEHNDIDISEYLPEFYRVLKKDAHCYIMCNNINLPHFFSVISQSDFHFVKLLCWDKVNKICGKYYMGQIEHIFFLRKGSDKPINDCGCSDLLSFPNAKTKNYDGTNIHDSQKPVNLFRKLIINSTEVGDTVLDPFLGSGTTAIAAMKECRHYIGFEMDREYYKESLLRISIASSPTLFQ